MAPQSPQFDTWMVTGNELIPMLVDIFVARRMTDKEGDPSKPWLKKYLQKPLHFDFSFPNKTEAEEVRVQTEIDRGPAASLHETQLGVDRYLLPVCTESAREVFDEEAHTSRHM